MRLFLLIPLQWSVYECNIFFLDVVHTSRRLFYSINIGPLNLQTRFPATSLAQAEFSFQLLSSRREGAVPVRG